MSPTFNYSTGNINNLTSGGQAAMPDIQGGLTDVRDFINGQLGDSNLSASAAIQESKLANGSTGLAKGVFGAYRNAALNSTDQAGGTVIPFDAEEFDVSGWFDTVTNIGRYTPQIPGYYRFSWQVVAGAAQSADTFWMASLRKNGVSYKNAPLGFQRGSTVAVRSGGTAVAQANGSTDFFDVVWTQGGVATQAIQVGLAFTYFQGELIGRS